MNGREDAVMAIAHPEPHFGTASAAKRGRNPKFPYVPIIDYGRQETGVHATRTEQVMGRAYADRADAVACAQRVIDANIARHERDLVSRVHRAMRERYGLPRELVGVKVTTAAPDANGEHPVGVIVSATADERIAGRTTLGLPYDEFANYSLVEWPTGRRWESPDDIRAVRAAF